MWLNVDLRFQIINRLVEYFSTPDFCRPETLGWQPSEPKLISDLDRPRYF